MLYVQNGGILNFIKVKIVWCEVLGFDQTTGLSLTMHQDWLTMQTQLRERCNLVQSVCSVRNAYAAYTFDNNNNNNNGVRGKHHAYV